MEKGEKDATEIGHTISMSIGIIVLPEKNF